MSLLPGTRPELFEILEGIDTGDKVEEYKNRDTSLDRDITIKVLLATQAFDHHRMTSFERDVPLMTSLDIYGIEQCNCTRAVILKLIEGPTLPDRIAAGPLEETIPKCGPTHAF